VLGFLVASGGFFSRARPARPKVYPPRGAAPAKVAHPYRAVFK
jgi:hypothetical protein